MRTWEPPREDSALSSSLSASEANAEQTLDVTGDICSDSEHYHDSLFTACWYHEEFEASDADESDEFVGRSDDNDEESDTINWEDLSTDEILSRFSIDGTHIEMKNGSYGVRSLASLLV